MTDRQTNQQTDMRFHREVRVQIMDLLSSKGMLCLLPPKPIPVSSYFSIHLSFFCPAPTPLPSLFSNAKNFNGHPRPLFFFGLEHFYNRPPPFSILSFCPIIPSNLALHFFSLAFLKSKSSNHGFLPCFFSCQCALEFV